jgi:hypothetical protein
MIKAILGYDVEPGLTAEQYEKWLFEVHAPDLLSNPHLAKLVLNKVLRPVTSTSGGLARIPDGASFYRISELHFADEAAFEAYQQWFAEHPLLPERGPSGRTAFRFYVITDETVLVRGDVPGQPAP